MPLQNRVAPDGSLLATIARGTWLGNRGVIHNAGKQIVRGHTTKAWIICCLQFRGRHREVMMPNRWTELFFLDEATAFAAGHRPCFQCRYADHQRFKIAWLKGNPKYGFNEKTSINEIDKIIHAERIINGKKRTHQVNDATALPNGTFIQLNNQAHLLANGLAHPWTPSGYENGIAIPANVPVTVLTPASIVNAIRGGYVVEGVLSSTY